MRTKLPLVLSLLIVVLAGCETVPFYDRGHLNDPSMLIADDPTLTHSQQKTIYSREGSIGGIGAGAGGGCGCY